MVTVIIWTVVAGLLIELFFQVVKYRDQLNKSSPQAVTAYGQLMDPSSYLSATQYLSGGSRRWGNYFLFRLTPPLIVFLLLAGVLERYYSITDVGTYTVTAALLSLLFRDIYQLFNAKFISEKLVHIANIILVITVAILVSFVANRIDLGVIAPSVAGLVDNLWSSLFVAMLILLYLQMTNMGDRRNDQNAEDTALDNYVVNSYNKIYSKYSNIIDEMCQKNSCSKQLLYAVLIYENMNRPAWLRRIESALVRLPKISLTVGLAQVKSDTPLSDEESICRAAEILKGSEHIDDTINSWSVSAEQYKGVLEEYNSSEIYVMSIAKIIERLRIYNGSSQ